MSYDYSEDGLVEQAVQDTLEDLGWTVKTAWRKESFGKNSLLGREHRGQVILERYLMNALQRYNPNLPERAYEQAIGKIVQRTSDQSAGHINKEKYEFLRNGVEVVFTDAKGERKRQKLRIFDFSDYRNNDFLAVRQFEVHGELYNCRPDVIGFVNGIPLVFFELKGHNMDLSDAYYDNLKNYKTTIPAVFDCNAFIILSNGSDSRVGTLTSPYKYFLEWKRIEEDQEGEVSLDTMLRGTCAPERLMDIFENFLLFDNSGGGIQKLMAKNHQYIGVNKVIENVKNIEDLQKKLGVYWHTQGSGKSYSMVFLCEKISRKLGGSYTFLLVADRTELESQLYDTFSGVGAVDDKNCIAGKKKGMTGREHLRELLTENHKYIFTLIHKFSINPEKETEYPLITKRKNIIVISDEAHRTQAGTYAQNMRYRGIPNASYLGFTGTPIIKEEQELTKNIFGEYVSVYDFNQAVADEATLPLMYLNRGEKLDIKNPELDEKMAAVFENEDLDDDQKKKLAYLFQREYPILTAEQRLNAIAKDLVWHFNERGYQGKGMLVALDKPTAVRMYNLIAKHWENYLSVLDEEIKTTNDAQEVIDLERKYNRIKATEVCVVVSPEQNEEEKFSKMGLDITPHRKKMAERYLEKEFKDPDNPFRLAIVCAMWITGFDAQCVSTIYLDKPIKGHTLMQTIARANRVYDDEKENGLIVDYGNVYQQLEKAYSVYGGGSGKGNPGKPNPNSPVLKPADKIKQLKTAVQETQAFLKECNFELSSLTKAKPMERIARLNDAVEAISLNEKTRTEFEVLARQVFKKYKALFPEKEAKRFTKKYNAIDGIYNQLNQNVRSADVTDIIGELQGIVDDNISLSKNQSNEEDDVYIDISKLDFDKLKKAFKKSKRKNTLVFNLQDAVEKKLDQMLQENPLRLEFYERYKKIIKEYNAGKSLENTSKAFDDLNDFINDLSKEQKRAFRENLSEDSLSIFDLLIEGKELNPKEYKKVKKIAAKTLEELKEEKLNIDHWYESRQVQAQIKSAIYNNLLHLPQEIYTDKEVGIKSANVYQHIFSRYGRVISHTN